MWDALTITEEDAAGLAELAQLDLAMAKDFATRARAETDPEIANDLARSYQRMARSYRQSLALKVRLAREIAKAQQELAERNTPPAPPRDEARIYRRVDDVRAAVERVIWDEHEASDYADDALDALVERLNLIAADDRFGDGPLDAQVAAVCRALGLDPRIASRWRDLPDPPAETLEPEGDDDDPPERRDSG